MPRVTVYHNSEFLTYRGNHDHIPAPTTPTAVIPTDEPDIADCLNQAYALTQHIDRAWWQNPNVVVPLRSTAIGDLIAVDEQMFVVEGIGFAPYAPNPVSPTQLLAGIYRQLENALDQNTHHGYATAVAQAKAHLRTLLAQPEQAAGLSSLAPDEWQHAQAGDRIGRETSGYFRIIHRRLKPKWRAQALAQAIPTAQVWLDGADRWAVVVPTATNYR